MIHVYSTQYENENAGRRYPLADDSDGIDNNVLLDCRIVVRRPPHEQPEITAVSASSELTTVDVDIDGHTIQAKAYSGSHIASYVSEDGSTSAWFVLGDVRTGYEFTGRVRLAPAVVTVDGIRVTSVQSTESVCRNSPKNIPDSLDSWGTGTYTAKVSGGVVVVPGYNVDARITDSAIRLDVRKGGGIGEYCQEVGGWQTCGGVMYSINGELPDAAGDIKILGGTGIAVIPVPEDHAIDIQLDMTGEDVLGDDCSE